MVQYTLIRSKRKTIAIYIKRDATVEVRAPLRVSKAEIDRFVLSKQDWILKHQAETARRAEEKSGFEPDYGDTVLLRGVERRITASDKNRIWFEGECLYLPPGLSPEEIKRAAVLAYRLEAKRRLTERTLEYAKRTGLDPSGVRITGARTRWGSCSGKNSISFSWRLILADDGVIDYVIVHELAHTREHNHSARFWAVVEAVLPDYRERQTRLKALQKRLACENWE